MKLLHFSDLHLDAPFGSSTMPVRVARGCRLRLRRTLLRILDMAVELEVDAVTIGGDLFEGDRASRDTIQFLLESFAQLAPIPVLIAPGNHDYYSPVSPYNRYDWPENVWIFRESRPTPFRLSDQVTIWGLAHTRPNVTDNPLSEFHVPERSGKHVLLMHGSVLNHMTEQRARYAPFQLQDVARSGIHFALLGHYHGAREITDPDGHVLGLYPGSPQPLDFSETGAHTVALVSFTDAGIEFEFHPTATQQFVTITQAVDDFSDTHSLGEAILQRAPQKASEANFLRVLLSGILPSGFDLQPGLLEEQLNQHFDFVIIEDHTTPQPGERLYADEQTVRGRFIRRLQTMMAEEAEDPDLIRLALRYGLQAFEQDELLPS